MRRATILAVVLAAALAPAASARPSLVVQASAFGVPLGDEMQLTAECKAADVRNIVWYVTRCSVGPVAAETHCGFECPGAATAFATGRAPAGSYELCVAAGSYGGGTPQGFHKCVPLDPKTHTAVITG